MRLTDQAYWDSSYGAEVEFYDLREHSVAKFLEKQLPVGHGKDFFEIGSYPGSFAPTICRKGFRANGVDFNRQNEDALPKWLSAQGFEVGEYYTADFFQFCDEKFRQFDLVCSFGFIEHFSNFLEVLDLHASLVAENGILVVTAPNFRGLMQYLPHIVFDRDNLQRHHIKSMDPHSWSRLLINKGFSIEFCGYFGGYRFWVDPSSRKPGIHAKALSVSERVIAKVGKLLDKTNLESGLFSSYCGIVATKGPATWAFNDVKVRT